MRRTREDQEAASGHLMLQPAQCNISGSAQAAWTSPPSAECSFHCRVGYCTQCAAQLGETIRTVPVAPFKPSVPCEQHSKQTCKAQLEASWPASGGSWSRMLTTAKLHLCTVYMMLRGQLLLLVFCRFMWFHQAVA